MGIFSRPKANNYVTVKGKGNKSEAEIVVRLMRAGYNVLRPCWEDSRYDLVIEDGDGKFWRVQCKTAWLEAHRAVLRFNAHSLDRKHNKISYRDQIDYFAVYSPDTDKVYFIHVNEVPPTSAPYLRLEPPQKGMTGKYPREIRYAADYEL